MTPEQATELLDLGFELSDLTDEVLKKAMNDVIPKKEGIKIAGKLIRIHDELKMNVQKSQTEYTITR